MILLTQGNWHTNNYINAFKLVNIILNSVNRMNIL